MRMWQVDPSKMCRKHLLGEHVECHMFVGTINKGISIDGYISKGLVVPQGIKLRHNLLAEEIERRGYKHKSPLPVYNCDRYGFVDPIANEQELRRRCKDCRF
jgi:hypothetical protein